MHDELILDTRRMDTIEAFDEDAGVVTAQAGCVLATLDEYLRERGCDTIRAARVSFSKKSTTTRLDSREASSRRSTSAPKARAP